MSRWCRYRALWLVIGIALCAIGLTVSPGDAQAAMRMSRFPGGHNPVPNWAPSRVDQGVDGTLSAEGFRAPFEVRVLYATAHDPGWDKGGYVVVQILQGPLQGQMLYVAEGVRAVVSAGQVVKPGNRLCDRAIDPYNGVFGGVETGFADPNDPLRPLAQALGGYAGDQSVAAITAGEAMNQLIRDLSGAEGTNESGVQPDFALLQAQVPRALNL